MGMLKITTVGSFGNKSKEFPAITHGHAHAVGEAIAWLAGELLKDAINSDHGLHENGHKPNCGFQK